MPRALSSRAMPPGMAPKISRGTGSPVSRASARRVMREASAVPTDHKLMVRALSDDHGFPALSATGLLAGERHVGRPLERGRLLLRIGGRQLQLRDVVGRARAADVAARRVMREASAVPTDHKLMVRALSDDHGFPGGRCPAPCRPGRCRPAWRRRSAAAPAARSHARGPRARAVPALPGGGPHPAGGCERLGGDPRQGRARRTRRSPPPRRAAPPPPAAPAPERRRCRNRPA
jgi:hypothetical protein